MYLRLQTLLKGPIAQASISTSGVLGLRLLMQAGTLLTLAYILKPAGFGAYVSLGALAVLLGTLASFGTQLTLLRDVVRDAFSRDASLGLALGTTALCGPVLFCVYTFISVFWLHPAETGVIAIVCIGLSELLLQPVLVIAAMERHAYGQSVRSQLLLVMPLAIRLIFALLIAWQAPSDPLAVFALCHLLAITFAVVIAIALAPAPWPWTWHLPSPAQWRDSSGYAFLNISASGVAELDKLLATKLLDAGPAGIYAAASRIIGSLVLPVIAMVISAMPRLFKKNTGHDSRLQYWLFASAGCYGFVSGFALWLFAPWFQSLFGPIYTDLAEIIRWLAWAVPAICLRAAAVNVLSTIDRPWLRVALEISGWCSIAVLAWLMSPTMGARGLAVAVACTEWILASTSWVIIWAIQRKNISVL